MGGGKDNQVGKGYYPPFGYPSAGAYASYPPVAYPYNYLPQGLGCPPPSGSYPYFPSGCPPYGHSGYSPSGYPPYGQSVHPHISSYPAAGHGHGNMGPMLAGGAVAAAAAAYGVHHLTHGHHHHGHHLGHFGKFKHYPHYGHYGKFKHGKFGKHVRFGGKHGFFDGKFRRWK